METKLLHFVHASSFQLRTWKLQIKQNELTENSSINPHQAIYSLSKRTATVLVSMAVATALTLVVWVVLQQLYLNNMPNIALACPPPGCFHTVRILFAWTIHHPCVPPSYLLFVLIGSPTAILVLGVLMTHCFQRLHSDSCFVLIFNHEKYRDFFLIPPPTHTHTHTLLLLNW